MDKFKLVVGAVTVLSSTGPWFLGMKAVSYGVVAAGALETVNGLFSNSWGIYRSLISNRNMALLGVTASAVGAAFYFLISQNLGLMVGSAGCTLLAIAAITYAWDRSQPDGGAKVSDKYRKPIVGPSSLSPESICELSNTTPTPINRTLRTPDTVGRHINRRGSVEAL